ncbi:hypothetical protein F5J12DRAFT_901883 [Pisolithus orientalis]|uniref:uncharacterized protein n=1 Tax=Pisolithus orientalis TaxID=936130 RepID=UPI0022248C49|nr:uncharacterized protein F5J12DRAFT_901883 [Pisolithus orientalis]KAI6034974.1 hypothetical protein F5J12DRAFT_901883 [Pisolithus orientalis]
MSTTPRIRVVVQLPYDRPENPLQDPPHIEWNAEKANILWEVIALSRTSDNGGTDWKGLAAHLEVPLPYLLYRAQARYEEDLRGLKDIPGVLSHPTSQQPTSGVPSSSRRPSSSAGALPHLDRGQSLSIRIPTRKISGGAASARTLTGSAMSATPLGVRLRLNSLTHKSPSKTRFPHAQRQGQARISSPTATLQEIVLRRSTASLRSPSPFSEGEPSDSSDTSEVMGRKEEEEERNAEEREALDKKLAQLQKMMTTEMVGLVRNPPSQNKGKEKEAIRGRTPFPMPIISTTTAGLSGVIATGSPAKPRFSEDIGFGFRQEGMGFAPRNRDHSASVSSVSSPQGSVPSIPSPTSPPSPGPVIIPSPPVISAQNARGHAHLRTIGQGTGPLYGAAVVSEGESTQGSTASSFSDLSGKMPAFQPSALESALMSNFRTGGSKMSTIARSRLGGRGTRQ